MAKGRKVQGGRILSQGTVSLYPVSLYPVSISISSIYLFCTTIGTTMGTTMGSDAFVSLMSLQYFWTGPD